MQTFDLLASLTQVHKTLLDVIRMVNGKQLDKLFPQQKTSNLVVRVTHPSET